MLVYKIENPGGTNMRRKVLLGLSFLLTLTLVACGGNSGPTNVSKDDTKINELKGKETTAVYIGDDLFELYKPFSQFLEKWNWSFTYGNNLVANTTQGELSETILYKGVYETLHLDGNNGSLEVVVANTEKSTPITEAEVISIKFTMKEKKDKATDDIFVLANGLNQTSTAKDINSVANELSLDKENDTSLSDGKCKISFRFLSVEGVIDDFTIADINYIEDNDLEAYELNYSGTDKEKILERSKVIEGTLSGQVEITSVRLDGSKQSTKEVLFTAKSDDGIDFIVGKNQAGFPNFPQLKEGDRVKIYYNDLEVVAFDNFSSTMNLIYTTIIYVNDIEYFCFE